MPEIIFNGPEGLLEGRYTPGESKSAPMALLAHPHPRLGGHMNDPLIHALYYAFVENGCAAMRFNTRGVGRSEGAPDNGGGELADAAAALDWLQNANPDNRRGWLCGFSFGAWVALQLMMRRPEICHFIAVAPLTRHHDFSFLSPCPADGLIVTGDCDTVSSGEELKRLVSRLKGQAGIAVQHLVIPGANHFFADKVESTAEKVRDYIAAKRDEDVDIEVLPPPSEETSLP